MKKILVLFSICAVYNLHAVREIHEVMILNYRHSVRSETLERKLWLEEKVERAIAKKKRAVDRMERENLQLRAKLADEKQKAHDLQVKLAQQKKEAEQLHQTLKEKDLAELEENKRAKLRAYFARFNNCDGLDRHITRMSKRSGYETEDANVELLKDIK